MRLDKPRDEDHVLQKGVGNRREGLGLSLYGDSKLLPTPSRVSACLLLGNHFTSGAGLFFFFFSLSLCCAISLSVPLVEGSVVGTGWPPRQNGWSQTTDCAVGSLWDSEEVGC